MSLGCVVRVCHVNTFLFERVRRISIARLVFVATLTLRVTLLFWPTGALLATLACVVVMLFE